MVQTGLAIRAAAVLVKLPVTCKAVRMRTASYHVHISHVTDSLCIFAADSLWGVLLSSTKSRCICPAALLMHLVVHASFHRPSLLFAASSVPAIL